MYIKKGVLIFSAVLLVVVTVVLTLGAINPFGFQNLDDLIRFSQIAKMMDRNFYREVDRERLMNGAMEGMAASLEDPYTGYLWGDEAKKYLEEVDGSYCGVGIYIENNVEDDTIQVVSAIAGSPAEEAGLTTGDKILKVNGTSYTGQEINEATSVMKGEKGTEVTLTIKKAHDDEVKDIVLIRREIKIASVTGTMVTDTIGRINITQFTSGCAEQFQEMYQGLKKEGMQSLIIDLRNNPGGILDEVVSIASLFVEKDEVIVYTEDRHGNRENYFAEGETEQIPIVLLTNQGSASASEILTGALKDYEVGYQIGEKTYGKGVVQGVYQTNATEVLSLTVARYFTPKGVCIHEKGIEPDLEISMDVEKYGKLTNLAPEEDEQLQAALNCLNQ